MVAVRRAYDAKYGSYTGSRPNVVSIALTEHRPAAMRAVVGILVGFAALIGFRLLMRP